MEEFFDLTCNTIWDILCFVGLRSEEVNSYQAVTVLIDFEKYQKIHSSVNVLISNGTSSKVCADSENEEYRKCDNRCVLSCRYVPSIAEMIISKDQCDKENCIGGCFCKNGLIRYQDKCVPARDCPARNGRSTSGSSEKPMTFWKHFPFFHRPNCGPQGCGVIEIHNHNEAVSYGNSKFYIFECNLITLEYNFFSQMTTTTTMMTTIESLLSCMYMEVVQ